MNLLYYGYSRTLNRIMIKELLYPFNPNYILENKRKIKKALLENSETFVEKKVAILGGYTTSAIKQVMELFLLNNGIKVSFYESEYNKFYEDAMFDNAELEAFKPDIIYVCTSNRNITKYPSLNDDNVEDKEEKNANSDIKELAPRKIDEE